MQADLTQAQQYYQQAQADLQAGNLAAYAKAIAKMEQEITNAAGARRPESATPSPARRVTLRRRPTPSPSASR